MAALKDSEANVAEPVNDPALDPETLDAASTWRPAAWVPASIAGASLKVPTAVSRAKRIDLSVKWAQKIASNNKYKYRYGATGPTYFDCSGYTGKAFSTGGKKLQRTSGAQYKAAPKKVKLSSLQKGDLGLLVLKWRSFLLPRGPLHWWRQDRPCAQPPGRHLGHQTELRGHAKHLQVRRTLLKNFFLFITRVFSPHKRWPR